MQCSIDETYLSHKITDMLDWLIKRLLQDSIELNTPSAERANLKEFNPFSGLQKLTHDGGSKYSKHIFFSHFSYQWSKGKITKKCRMFKILFQAACVTEEGDACVFPFKEGEDAAVLKM